MEESLYFSSVQLVGFCCLIIETKLLLIAAYISVALFRLLVSHFVLLSPFIGYYYVSYWLLSLMILLSGFYTLILYLIMEFGSLITIFIIKHNYLPPTCMLEFGTLLPAQVMDFVFLLAYVTNLYCSTITY